MGPFGRSGGIGNFDAGPSRDLNFDSLSWFEPSFLWRLPHFLHCVFCHLRHGRLKRTIKHMGIEIKFCRPFGWCLRFRRVEISVRDMCHKTAGFTTCCLSLWCCRCLWRMSSSRSRCDIFTIEGIVDQMGSKFVVFHPMSSLFSRFSYDNF